ncbi:MAG TPA: isoprenyl transferase [Thermodesulfovibrionales bacterium]|jgi:undecaprenyl diphosphate synthase|nr:isoprenyl transferase [Thermodesulfovibrionales bacterium]
MLLSGRIPAHIAIIMDGNGRWAAMRGLPRVEGHKRGAERAKEIITAAKEIGVDTLTLYAFSIENWQRPDDEVSMLMRLLEFYIKKEFHELIKKGMVFRTIGEIWRLPENIRGLLEDMTTRSSGNTGMKLVLALSYGGRNEIIRAVRKLVDSKARSEDITDSSFESLLDTSGLPAPDLIVRTSGEKRISNFLLWQAAYAEFYFTDTLWPDFTKDEFFLALHDYQQRERRFGAVPLKVGF